MEIITLLPWSSAKFHLSMLVLSCEPWMNEYLPPTCHIYLSFSNSTPQKHWKVKDSAEKILIITKRKRKNEHIWRMLKQTSSKFSSSAAFWISKVRCFLWRIASNKLPPPLFPIFSLNERKTVFQSNNKLHWIRLN